MSPDLPVTSSKPTDRIYPRKRTVRPTDGPVGELPERSCGCGCGEKFFPDRISQKYVRDHRFNAYASHECPSCGIIHRVGVSK